MSGLQAAGGTAITTTEHTDETSTHATTARVLVFVVAVAGYAADLATKTAALAHLDPANPPARATSEAALATPDYKVEFIVTAAL